MVVEAQFSEGFLLLCHFSCQSNQMEEIMTAGFRLNTMNYVILRFFSLTYYTLYNTHGHVISDVSRSNSLWVIRNPYSNDSTRVDQVLCCPPTVCLSWSTVTKQLLLTYWLTWWVFAFCFIGCSLCCRETDL